jgi:hypothetical protein
VRSLGGTFSFGSGGRYTLGLVGAVAAGFLASWFGLREASLTHLAFSTTDPGLRPWAILLYPFSSYGNGQALLWELFSLYWLYIVGSRIEAELGGPKVLLAWGVFTALGALGVWLGAVALHREAMLVGASLPLAAFTVVFGVRNRSAQILLMFVLPIPAMLLAYLAVALVVFGYGNEHPLMGVFAALPLILGWLYALDKLPFWRYGTYRVRSQASDRRNERRQIKLRDKARDRQREREERERLRKLFERSVAEDENDRGSLNG